MPCFRPLHGWRAKRANPNGSRSVVFNRAHGFSDLPVTVPCGQCIGCRLERSRQWAVRCVHEAQLHEDNCFVTLTYDDEHLPVDGSLKVRDFQLFMKRLRKTLAPRKLRFFHCGEYGDENWRPHYHALLFGFDPPDKMFYTSKGGNTLYLSAQLQEIWGRGFVTVGNLTFESAAYVARYCVKKVTGDDAAAHYQVCDPDTGEIHQVAPEYVTMSRRPGIGADWLEKFSGDVYPHDEVIVRGKPARPPRAYDKWLAERDVEMMEAVKRKRVADAQVYAAHTTESRLRVRENVVTARVQSLKRSV